MNFFYKNQIMNPFKGQLSSPGELLIAMTIPNQFLDNEDNKNKICTSSTNSIFTKTNLDSIELNLFT